MENNDGNDDEGDWDIDGDEGGGDDDDGGDGGDDDDDDIDDDGDKKGGDDDEDWEKMLISVAPLFGWRFKSGGFVPWQWSVYKMSPREILVTMMMMTMVRRMITWHDIIWWQW